MIEIYFEYVRTIINSTPIVQACSITTDRRSGEIGFLRGDLVFIDGSRLHFREFVRQVADTPPDRYTYAYHYQTVSGNLIFRYDNTSHFPALSGFPHHKHIGNETDVSSVSPPDFMMVLKEIESTIAADKKNADI
jgi:hypothetical protein